MTADMDRLVAALRPANSPSKARVGFYRIGCSLDKSIRLGNSVSRGTRQANVKAGAGLLLPLN